jgi:ATP adenylyltransferase
MLNLYPYNNGHMMVIPNQHVSALEALEEETLAEMMALTQRAIRVLKEAYSPQGFNIGINQGEAAGAGIAAHLHQHIVPRWNGDTNFMTIIAETRTIPEWIDETYERLRAIWLDLPDEPSP